MSRERKNKNRKAVSSTNEVLDNHKEVFTMSTIITLAFIAVVIGAYEKSDLRKTSHITHEMVTGSNTQLTILTQPR